MYYWDIYEILKEKEEFLTKQEIIRLYEKTYKLPACEVNVNKALAKLRRRPDVTFKIDGRVYYYKFQKVSNDKNKYIKVFG